MPSAFASVQLNTDWGQRDVSWWIPGQTDLQVHKKMTAALKRIHQTTLWRKAADLQNYRLYGGAPVMGLGISTYTRPVARSGGTHGLNISRSCSDALTAKLMSDEMRPRVLTSGADWDMQQRAKGLEKFLDGQAHEIDLNEKFAWMVLQTCIFGTGILKFYRRGKGKKQEICVDTVPTWSLQVDDQEAIYGRPPTFYQRMWYDRAQLYAMFPKDKKARDLIAKAKLQTDEDLNAVGYQATADQVLVTEAWRMPSGPGADDGMHAMSLENGLLYKEKYEYDEPPFVFYTLWPQPVGFYGVGIVKQVLPLQIQLNVLMQKIERSFHLLGSGHVLIDRGSKMNKHKIDNEIGSIWEYVGQKPDIVATNPVPPQVFEHLDRIYTRAFEVSGISQLEAQSLKPKGLNSGVALDAYLDITTERFNVSQRRLQKAYVRACKWILRLADEIAETNPDFGVLSEDRSHADIVQFKKHYLEENKYVMRLYPTSSLADDPAEKMEQVERMVNAGWIDPTTARRLLDMPDLEEFDNLDLSGFNAVEHCISAALHDGKYIGPERFMPIGTQDAPGPAMKQVQNALVRAWTKGAPESKLRHLKNWLSDAVSMMPPGAAQAMAAMPPANDQANPFAQQVQQDVQGQAASQAAQGLVAG